MNPSPSVRELARRHRALLRRRAPWDAAWQSLADHFLPTRCRLHPADNDAGRAEGRYSDPAFARSEPDAGRGQKDH